MNFEEQEKERISKLSNKYLLEEALKEFSEIPIGNGLYAERCITKDILKKELNHRLKDWLKATPKKDLLKPYPDWICDDCTEFCYKKSEYSTYHLGTCGVCGERKIVTEPRDYGYPEFEGFEKP